MKKILLPSLLWLAAPALAQPATAPQPRELAPFRAINVGNGIELLLTAGHAQHVEVSAVTAEVRDHITTTVAGGVLTIRYDNPEERSSANRSRIEKQLRVLVTADQLSALTASSGAPVSITGNVSAADFQLDISSGATLKASDVQAGVLIVRQNGGSTVALAGRAPRFDLRLSSGSTFNGENLLTEHAQVEAGSGSTARVTVKTDLLAEASGGASIRYLGTPELTKQVSAGGTVSSQRK